VLGFCCSALKAGKATDFHPQDLDLDLHGPMFTPLNVKASFTCEIERKEHFWKVLMNILNIMYFPRPSCSKCNFPSSGNLKDLFYPISTLLFSQKPELNTDILF